MKSISVVMLVCDRDKFIYRAIESVLAQTYKPEEVIVIDNGERLSVDFKELPGHIRYYKAIPYLGIGQALNVGVSVSQGQYLCFLEDDDYWPVDYLEKIVSQMTGDAQVYASDIYFDSESGLKLYKSPQSNPQTESVFISNPGFNISNLCLERSALDLVRGFNTRFKTSADKGIVLELLLKGKKVRAVPGNHVVSNIEQTEKYSAKWQPLLNSRIAFYKYYCRHFSIYTRLKYLVYSFRVVCSVYLHANFKKIR